MALLLGVTTLVSGSATVYYAGALQEERARATHLTNAFPAQSDPAPTGQTETSPPAAAVLPTEKKAASEVGNKTDYQVYEAAQEEAERAVARYRLEQLRDPKVQARADAEIARQARDMLKDIAPPTGLSKEDMERLVEATQVALLEDERRTLECQADPGCDGSELEASIVKGLEEEAAKVLDAEKFARLKAYMDAWQERFFLQMLRDRLPPESTLSDAETEALSLALADERRKFVAEAEARDEKVELIAGGLRSAAMPGTTRENDKRVESATRFIARRYERAEQLLDGAQLAEFKAWQERTLAAYKSELNEQAIAAAARKAAGTGQEPALP
jgi:hypothetical protein